MRFVHEEGTLFCVAMNVVRCKYTGWAQAMPVSAGNLGFYTVFPLLMYMVICF